MTVWLAVLGAIALCAVGAWTVTHPDGGYRAAGGVGSGLSPSTRRACGVALIVFAVVVVVIALADPAMALGRSG
ncbi:MAG TPA: hypothetical protein VJ804_09535, partial [Acidimicrobiales bacterium]|nr:hypothetical protein [Acidimicrobiales bacterium]